MEQAELVEQAVDLLQALMVLLVGDVVFNGGREGGDELNVCGNTLAVIMVVE